MGIGDWKASMMYQNNEGYDLAGLSWDEKYVALNKSITTSENQLFLYELGSKKLPRFQKVKKAIYRGSRFQQRRQNLLLSLQCQQGVSISRSLQPC